LRAWRFVMIASVGTFRLKAGMGKGFDIIIILVTIFISIVTIIKHHILKTPRP